MAVNNSLTRENQRLNISEYLTREDVNESIKRAVGGKDSQRFVAAIISATTTNPALQGCTNQSILSGALLGESLKLSPSPQLGHYYLVPFNDKEKGKVAQFQLGYKGYIQLAIRSGKYKKLNVIAIKEGELDYYDPVDETIKINLKHANWDERESLATIGYYAFFELINGFRKAIFWSKKQMESHAIRYSPGYKAKKGFTFWEKNFDAMAYKTMLRQLIGKWGIMSADLQEAYDSDMAVINENGDRNYVEVDAEIIDATPITEQLPKEVPPEKTENSENNTNDATAALFGN